MKKEEKNRQGFQNLGSMPLLSQSLLTRSERILWEWLSLTAFDGLTSMYQITREAQIKNGHLELNNLPFSDDAILC